MNLILYYCYFWQLNYAVYDSGVPNPKSVLQFADGSVLQFADGSVAEF